jgi:hypothetical protein
MNQDGASAPTQLPHSPRPYTRGIRHPGILLTKRLVKSAALRYIGVSGFLSWPLLRNHSETCAG